MGMIRKQFFIDREASRRLKQAAVARGVSEAELIRQGIERVVAETEDGEADWRKAFRAAVDAITPGQFDGLAERVAENRRRRAVTSTARRERNWGQRDTE
jgi:hypothetical protein